MFPGRWCQGMLPRLHQWDALRWELHVGVGGTKWQAQTMRLWAAQRWEVWSSQRRGRAPTFRHSFAHAKCFHETASLHGRAWLLAPLSWPEWHQTCLVLCPFWKFQNSPVCFNKTILFNSARIDSVVSIQARQMQRTLAIDEQLSASAVWQTHVRAASAVLLTGSASPLRMQGTWEPLVVRGCGPLLLAKELRTWHVLCIPALGGLSSLASPCRTPLCLGVAYCPCFSSLRVVLERSGLCWWDDFMVSGLSSGMASKAGPDLDSEQSKVHALWVTMAHPPSILPEVTGNLQFSHFTSLLW